MKVSVRVLAGVMLCALCVGMHATASDQQSKDAEDRFSVPPEARVDINTATMEELLSVPGMTRTWAGRIIRFRPYHSKLDLLNGGILSGSVYDRVKGYVIAHRDSH
jgi:DNA uptake protein ComE-like DNA-binding protein